jgi:hypothetical protein
MDIHTPILNPSELYDRRKNKDASRLKAYNKILEQIYNKVRVISQYPNSPCYFLYTVPHFIFGLPKIDLEDCIVYLIYQLRHAGYVIRYTPPNMLFISWTHHEKSYIIEQSPIMKSMLESAERTQAEIERKEKEASRLLYSKKSQKKVRINTPGQLQSISGSAPGILKTPPYSAINTVLNRPLSNPTAGPPPPSTSNYQPPSSFLKNMSNPNNNISRPNSLPDYFK